MQAEASVDAQPLDGATRLKDSLRPRGRVGALETLPLRPSVPCQPCFQPCWVPCLTPQAAVCAAFITWLPRLSSCHPADSAVTISATLPRGTLRASDAEEGAQGHTAGHWDLDLGRAGHLGWMTGEFRAHCIRHGRQCGAVITPGQIAAGGPAVSLVHSREARPGLTKIHLRKLTLGSRPAFSSGAAGAAKFLRGARAD